MEGIHTVKDLLRHGDWLVKVDLKDAYFAIPIDPTHRMYLRCQVLGKIYQFMCLPFGLSSAPWVFTKTLKPVLVLLRETGMRLVAYIDDILILVESKETALNHAEGMVYLLECLGFVINQDKLVFIPSQTIEFLGLTIDTINMELLLPPHKIKMIRAESRKLLREGTTSAHISTTTGENECDSMRDPPSPSILSPFTDGTGQYAREEFPELQLTGCLADNLSRGVELVGHSNVQVEWEINPQDRDRSNYRLRRIPEGLGSPLPPPDHRGGMVSRGSEDAHQLLAAASCHSGSQIICQRQNQNFYPPKNRQYYSGGIHKSSGRYNLPRASEADKELVDVVPGKEYPHHGTTPPRVTEHDCRCGVSNYDRQDKLEAEPNYLSQDQSTMGPIGSGPLCFPPVNPVPTLLQLAARSICRSNRCVSPDMDTHEGIYQPTMEPSGEDSISSADTAGQHCAGSPSVEVATMVPHSATNVSRLSSINNIRSPSDVQSGPVDDAPTTSCMAYLWERYRGQHLSEEATDLMLKSWRAKTNRSYDSLFIKWERWCSERSSDPISGPVTEVANFLAYLYKEGYQYSSINSYQSAISSVHDKIDGVTVGQTQ